MNSTNIVVAATHSASEQTISALSKYRRFEISIGPRGDGFYADLIFLSTTGECMMLVMSHESASGVLLTALDRIHSILKGSSVLDDEAPVRHLILEGATQYVSFDEALTLVENGLINCLVTKI